MLLGMKLVLPKRDPPSEAQVFNNIGGSNIQGLSFDIKADLSHF